MAKFCGNCGAPLDDSARVCGRCGAFVEPPSGGGQPRPVRYTPPKQPNPKLKKIVILALIAVAVIAVVVGVIRYNSPASVAQRYFKATLTNSKLAARMTAYDTQAMSLQWYDGDEEEFFENQSDWLDEDITSWNEYYKAIDANQKERLEDEYGKYKLTIDVKKVKDISAKKIRDDYEYELDSLEDATGFDRDQIKAGKRVTLKYALKGEDGTERDTLDIILVRMGMTWKVLTTD